MADKSSNTTKATPATSSNSSITADAGSITDVKNSDIVDDGLAPKVKDPDIRSQNEAAKGATPTGPRLVLLKPPSSSTSEPEPRPDSVCKGTFNMNDVMPVDRTKIKSVFVVLDETYASTGAFNVPLVGYRHARFLVVDGETKTPGEHNTGVMWHLTQGGGSYDKILSSVFDWVYTPTAEYIYKGLTLYPTWVIDTIALSAIAQYNTLKVCTYRWTVNDCENFARDMSKAVVLPTGPAGSVLDSIKGMAKRLMDSWKSEPSVQNANKAHS